MWRSMNIACSRRILLGLQSCALSPVFLFINKISFVSVNSSNRSVHIAILIVAIANIISGRLKNMLLSSCSPILKVYLGNFSRSQD